jgi:hypothetical protein
MEQVVPFIAASVAFVGFLGSSTLFNHLLRDPTYVQVQTLAFAHLFLFFTCGLVCILAVSQIEEEPVALVGTIAYTAVTLVLCGIAGHSLYALQ